MSGRRRLQPRPGLAEIAPYSSPKRPVPYQMNTNESPYPPARGLVDRVVEELTELDFNRYPDDRASALADGIAERNGWRSDGVWVANGSNEVLLHLLLAYGGPQRTALVFSPTYSLHSSIPRITSTRVIEEARSDDLLIDLDAAVAAISRQPPDVVFVCSPNNPSGECEPLGTVRALLEETPGLVVVDEAYIEFAQPDCSVRPLLDGHDNLLVVKTFSKAWRLAGVRIGYMLADPAIVQHLARVRLPYNLSSVTQAMGRAALAFADETLATVEAIVLERDRIAIELTAMGLKTYPSHANFVLFEVIDAESMWRALVERGVLLRNYSNQPGLEGCLRVTVGKPHENDAFLAAIREALDG